MKKLIITILAIIMVASTLLLTTACVKVESELEEFTFAENFKVGIISDFQLPPLEKDDNGKYVANLTMTLQVLKDNDVDMIIVPGDIGDASSNYAYTNYNNCVEKVFGDDKPIIQNVMGNHDYWGNGAKNRCRRIFKKNFGKSPWTHYVANGYHFIGASPANGDMESAYGGIEDWLTEQLEIASKDDPTKPIFVSTHNGAKDTIYGSDDWGDKSLNDIIKDYPQVVSISGHSHYSILDERSIHQQNYTSFSTQSISYTELEEGKTGGSIPTNADITPMGYIMEFGADSIDLIRMNFKTGLEEKADMRWSLPTNITKADFIYTNEIRKQSNQKPTMESAVIDNKNNSTLTFNAGIDDDFVHSYKLVWSNGVEQVYFSDFYNGIKNMKTIVNMPVLDMEKGTYSVKVYAVDSYNAVSDNFVTINNVVIK